MIEKKKRRKVSEQVWQTTITTRETERQRRMKNLNKAVSDRERTIPSHVKKERRRIERKSAFQETKLTVGWSYYGP